MFMMVTPLDNSQQSFDIWRLDSFTVSFRDDVPGESSLRELRGLSQSKNSTP